MADLVQVLFPEPPLVRTPLRLLRWWESKRLTYNLVVGGAGLVTLGVFFLFPAALVSIGWLAALLLR